MLSTTRSRACSVPGCERRQAEMGFCAAHAQRKRRTGSPGTAPIAERPRRPRRACSVGGCERASYCRGMCTTHYQRHRAHGSTDEPERATAEAHHSWRGDDVGYRAVHARLVSSRGPASAHACVDCGGAAQQWSYDNADRDERSSDQGAFSVDLDRYDPRCRRCHHAFDCRTSSTHVHDERFCYHTAAA